MEYKGKESKKAWHPECVKSRNGESFNNTLLFTNVEDAWDVIDTWISNLTKNWNPASYSVKRSRYHASILNSEENVDYLFQIDLFNLFV